ncbi:MAG: class I SAM-dependent methyltransferase, partial [Dehalococcoidales bacterium]
KAFRDVVARLPRPWLEVGVGSGRFAEALGIETGIDPSVELLEMAKRRGITVFRASGEEKVFDEGTFGTVFLIVTLCFVDSPLAVLGEAYRVLKPDGKIALGLILRESPWGQYYLMKKEEGHPFYRFASFHSYQELTRLLKRTGFIIEKVLSTLFQRPNEVTRLESPRENFSAEAGFTVIVARKTATGSQ